MLALVMHEHRRHAVKIIDCTSLSFFVLALLTIVATGHELFSNYRILAAWGIFAVVTWAALLAGFPFTLQYTNERTPREVWKTAISQDECDYDRGMRRDFHAGHDSRSAGSSRLHFVTGDGDPCSYLDSRLRLQSLLSRPLPQAVQYTDRDRNAAMR